MAPQAGQERLVRWGWPRASGPDVRPAVRACGGLTRVWGAGGGLEGGNAPGTDSGDPGAPAVTWRATAKAWERV